MPVAAPTAVGFSCRTISSSVHTTSVPAGASIVVVNARAADAVGGERAAGVEAEPSEPEQSRAEQREWHVVRQQAGSDGSHAACRRTIAATSAATPAFTWTTVPPAKSSAPIFDSHPPPQTQCATGL